MYHLGQTIWNVVHNVVLYQLGGAQDNFACTLSIFFDGVRCSVCASCSFWHMTHIQIWHTSDAHWLKILLCTGFWFFTQVTNKCTCISMISWQTRSLCNHYTYVPYLCHTRCWLHLLYHQRSICHYRSDWIILNHIAHANTTLPLLSFYRVIFSCKDNLIFHCSTHINRPRLPHSSPRIDIITLSSGFTINYSFSSKCTLWNGLHYFSPG